MNRLFRKIATTLTLIGCLIVVMISAAVRGNGAVVQTSGGLSDKVTIVLDAGHGGYVVSIVLV